MKQPPRQDHMSMLLEWRDTTIGMLEGMIADLKAERLVDDTLSRDFDQLRHLMGRREILVNEILLRGSRHRGPGMPLYREMGGGGETG